MVFAKWLLGTTDQGDFRITCPLYPESTPSSSAWSGLPCFAITATAGVGATAALDVFGLGFGVGIGTWRVAIDRNCVKSIDISFYFRNVPMWDDIDFGLGTFTPLLLFLRTP